MSTSSYILCLLSLTWYILHNRACIMLIHCQSMTLHIELHAFPMHLQCISKALLHTLTHCVLDSTCYTTLHHPLHPRLHMCHLCLFVCLFTFVTGACVACFVCLFVCFPFQIGSIN